MTTQTGPLRGSGPISRARTTTAGLATLALVAVGLGTSAPASSAVDPACPDPFPVADLARHQAVHGLTVTEGTEPGPFTGEILGVIDDGIAPDLDMILARLTSPEIDRVGGIWQGMSGSPVYAEDGRLIGAVSYGLSFGSSPVAGITPAADMEKLLDTFPEGAVDSRSRVSVPSQLRTAVRDAPDTTQREASSDLTRLKLPVGVSGMVGSKRLNQLRKAMDMSDVHLYKAGAVSADSPSSAIVPGGNLAASVAYGDLSVIGVGTATAVCGDEVLAFGHPMNYSGPSTMSMHGADAIFIQEESLGAPFKVANAGAPVGGIVQDRIAGLLGVDGAVPDTADVTSFVSVPGEGSRTGTTHISVPNAVPDLAPFHLLTDQDRIFDGISGGRAVVTWRVSGSTADGGTFSYTRRDRFANSFDISFEPVFDLSDQLFQLQNNSVEKVTIDSVRTRSVMNRDFASYTLKSVQVRQGGRFVHLARNHTLKVKPGVTKRFRVLLSSAELGTRRLPLTVRFPAKARGKSGSLEFIGGNSFFGGFGFDEFGNGPSASDLDELLLKLAAAPRNDDVVVNLNFFTRRPTFNRQVTKRADAVVDGQYGVQVRVQRRR
ncbi:MAG TPA: SpoIVB peptidase S55 domain-containing protein [Nocardioidaceae bacterium]|jgi:hypothetical protein|nr:SpoIVB peptidase S55 domain-containing protein [Nocardioidaceae bacterium]